MDLKNVREERERERDKVITIFKKCTNIGDAFISKILADQ